MAAAADKRGLKRICTSCGTRFYDMNKRPILCPNCSTEFTSEIKIKSRRGRAAIIEDAAEETENKKPVEADLDEDDATVSLEEVALEEDADEEEEEVADADLELDEDLDDLDDDFDDEDEDLEVLEDEGDDTPKKGKK